MQFLSNKQLDVISDLIDRFDPPLRSRKLDNKTAFSCLCYALQTGVAWKYVPVSGCTFSAAYKRFQCWVRQGVIRNVWVQLLNLYSNAQLKENPEWFKSLFIDTTLVKNLAGTDCVGRNPTDRGRLGSKTSVLCKLRKRHTVENLFCRLKQFKRVRHRMDRLASVYEAEIHAALCVMLLKQMQNSAVMGLRISLQIRH